MSDTYDRQTAKLAARIIESFPEIPANMMQHCVQNTPRIMEAIRKLLERDAVLKHGIWCTLPKDEPREHGLITVSDKWLARAQVAPIGRAANCWDGYLSKSGTPFAGLAETLEGAVFEAQRLVKIPLAQISIHERGRTIFPWWINHSGLQDCAKETGARCWLRQKSISFRPGERILFNSSGLVCPWGGECHYFWIHVDVTGTCSLHIAQEPPITDFTHIVFREGEIGIE